MIKIANLTGAAVPFDGLALAPYVETSYDERKMYSRQSVVDDLNRLVAQNKIAVRFGGVQLFAAQLENFAYRPEPPSELYALPPAADIAALKATSTRIVPDRSTILTLDGRLYFYNTNSIATDNGTTIIQPSDKGATIPGRWISVLSTGDRTASAISTTLAKTTSYLGITSTSIARTVTLQPVSVYGEGYEATIADESFAAGTNNITIDADGAELINGSGTALINTDGGVMRIKCTGATWIVTGIK